MQHFIVTGRPDRHNGAGNVQLYEQYLRHLYATSEAAAEQDGTTQGYEDYLQAPLQVDPVTGNSGQATAADVL